MVLLSSQNTVHVRCEPWHQICFMCLMPGIVWAWSFDSCSWLNVKWPSSIWSLWVIHNKQMILKPRLHSLRGRPVIGCNPVLLSSPDGRKWERKVSVDNGYTEMFYKSLSLSLHLSLSPTHMRTYIQTQSALCPWSMMDYCGKLSVVLLPAHSFKQLGHRSHCLVHALAHLIFVQGRSAVLNHPRLLLSFRLDVKELDVG